MSQEGSRKITKEETQRAVQLFASQRAALSAGRIVRLFPRQGRPFDSGMQDGISPPFIISPGASIGLALMLGPDVEALDDDFWRTEMAEQFLGAPQSIQTVGEYLFAPLGISAEMYTSILLRDARFSALRDPNEALKEATEFITALAA